MPPVQQCSANRKPGWKYGARGHCYTYTAGDKVGSERARAKAVQQGKAIEKSRGNW